MRRVIPVVGVVCVFVLAGCLDLFDRDPYGVNDWEPGESRQCIGEVCLTDPEAPYARYVEEEYGLTLIADSPNSLSIRGVDGDWAIFQFATGGRASWIFAYNFSDDRLIEADGRGDYHMTRTHLVDDRAVIYREPRAGAEIRHIHMLLWNLSSGESRVLETGLGGGISGGVLLGFDGQWALFGNRGSDDSEENALWAMDVDSGELVKVYQPVLEPDEDGWEERMGLAGIEGGRAFYSLWHSHPERDSRWSIGMVEVATGDHEIVYEGSIRVGGGPELSVGPRHIVWTAGVGYGLWALEIETGEVFELSMSGERHPHPRIGGSWAVYHDLTFGQRGFIAVNLDTGERVETRTTGRDVSFQDMRTDGNRIVGGVGILSGEFPLPHQNPQFPFVVDLNDLR